jgi:multisubunit Na+/H+ antiporter MnhB subunit
MLMERNGRRVVTIDPDLALAMGVNIGSTIGALTVWFAWGSPPPPSVALAAAMAAAALAGATLLGYLACKAAQWSK